jgi:hypothetical protein
MVLWANGKIYNGNAEVVRTRQSGRNWHFGMWISEERKYVCKTLRTTHLDTAVERADNEFIAIKANVNAGRPIYSPTVWQATDEYFRSLAVQCQSTCLGIIRLRFTSLAIQMPWADGVDHMFG